MIGHGLFNHLHLFNPHSIAIKGKAQLENSGQCVSFGLGLLLQSEVMGLFCLGDNRAGHFTPKADRGRFQSAFPDTWICRSQV
jgi:hypothetical protein